MADFPVQVSKVQAPPLRDETLARDRLLDWLSVKIHRRVVLLVAEAGYGKTTLLADFTRRTRLRVLWFRLDRGDRDWVGFIAHLVAAFAVHVPDFAPSTRALLREMATTVPSLETVLETFLRELAGLGPEPSAFVFDDFHLVEDSADIRSIVRGLLTRGPERMSFVFASRREPPIRLARLRALGEVAELGTDDLRFDATETERLFRETYEIRLEPSLLAELSRRTEGWAASLQLVRAAIHDRDPGQVRSFITSLSGAEGHLYEYLAEEVIGELPEDLQQFLMRTSVLETVDLMLGPVAAGVSVEEAKRLIEEAERHGLFGRGGGRGRGVARAHPLVREFLRARLALQLGESAVKAIHRNVAAAALQVDWQSAASHYLAAGMAGEAAAVVAGSIESIVRSGALAAAGEILDLVPGGLRGPAGLVLESRFAQQRGAHREAVALAEAALEGDPGSPVALLNLVSARSLAGDVESVVIALQRLQGVERSDFAELGSAFERLIKTSANASLPETLDQLTRVTRSLEAAGAPFFVGVGHLNIASVALQMNLLNEALEASDRAIQLLSATGEGVHLVAARLLRAAALAYVGRMDEARCEIQLAEASATPGQQREVALEVGYVEGFLGDAARAWPAFRRIPTELDPAIDIEEQALAARAILRMRDGDLENAVTDAASLRHGELRLTPAFDAQRYLIQGLVGHLAGSADALASIRAGRRIAQGQGAAIWTAFGEVLEAIADPSLDLSATVIATANRLPVVLSMLAEALVGRLIDLSDNAFDVLVREAVNRPWRWRYVARAGLKSGDRRLLDRSAQLLESVGVREDVQLLHEAGRASKRSVASGSAHRLARRLAERVFVDDLGRVTIRIGGRVVESKDVRRRVLALLCFLLTRPQFAATRDEAIDSLWPDMDPSSAVNSLNQTAYFLRRVFEPDYREEVSPGYLCQDGETIWLDSSLVDCRSRRCVEIIRSMPAEPSPEGSIILATEYRGRFALEFAYDEWSVEYRDALHAGYLRVMEHAIRMDLNTGQVARGTFLAERAAEIDPDSDEIQIALIRLYRMSGAHAAAAERYGHYARVMKDLGVEPLALADL